MNYKNKSQCCNAPTSIYCGDDFYGDEHRPKKDIGGQTCYYICSVCSEPCDVWNGETTKLSITINKNI